MFNSASEDRLVIALDQSSARMPAIVLRLDSGIFCTQAGRGRLWLTALESSTSRRVSGKQNSALHLLALAAMTALVLLDNKLLPIRLVLAVGDVNEVSARA